MDYDHPAPAEVSPDNPSAQSVKEAYDRLMASDENRVFFRTDITCELGRGARPYRVAMATNDNNDDGYPEEVESWTMWAATLKEAMQIAGGPSRIGLYGQPVLVTYEGRVI